MATHPPIFRQLVRANGMYSAPAQLARKIASQDRVKTVQMLVDTEIRSLARSSRYYRGQA